MIRALRITGRTLLESPVLSGAVALHLALGIGANAALFSALHVLLLKPLPFPEPERLVALFESHPQIGEARVSLANLLDWREQSRGFAAMAGYRFRTFAFATDAGEPPDVIRATMATSDLFRVLGAAPEEGRSWTEEEEEAQARVIVLSDALRHRRFGAEDDIVGRRVLLNEVPHTVLGILPPTYTFPAAGPTPEAYIPIRHTTYGQNRRLRSLQVIARLADGVSPQVARSELKAIAARVSSDHENALWSAEIKDLHETLYGANRRPLLLLFGSGLLLLLIACANIAHLLAAQFLARRRNIAVRIALGARTLQLGRGFFLESALLSLLGAVSGLWVAHACLSGLPRVLELLGGVPEVAGGRLSVDSGALAFASALAVLTTLAFGMIPILLTRRTDLLNALNDTPPTGARSLLRGALVAGQIAFSTVLLLAAGLLLRSFYSILAADPGFESAGVRTFGLGLPEMRYSERQITDFHRRLCRELEKIEGVEAVGAAARVPAGPRLFSARFRLDPGSETDARPSAAINVVSPDFFKALLIPRVEGRTFSYWDRVDGARVAVVNQAFRATYGAAVGQRLRLSWRSVLHPPEVPWEIVGVVGDTRLRSLDRAAEPAIYLPLTQFPSEGAVYLLRTEREDPAFYAAVEKTVATLDADLAAPTVGSLERTVRQSLADRRLALLLVGTFAALGLLLTAVGIYGLLAFLVMRRRREMAIRMALGARRSQVSELLLHQALRLSLSGLAMGVVAFFGVARWIESHLYGASAKDPAMILAVTLVICGVTLLAAAVPSRHLGGVSPPVLLRDE